jgi:enabled protein
MPPMDTSHMGGLAAALQAAKLKKTSNSNLPKENSGGSTTSSNSSGYGTIGRGKEERPALASGGGMASMMDEMQKTLARRRAKVDRQVDDEQNDRSKKSSSPSAGSDGGKNNRGSNSGSESPKPARKRFGSMADDLDIAKFNGEASGGGSAGGISAEQLEAVKQEILDEMRKEVNKAKQEIIEAMRVELNRR